MAAVDEPPDPIGFAATRQKKTFRDRAAERPSTLNDPELQSLSPEEIRRALHELRVQQIELEIQNEELRQT